MILPALSTLVGCTPETEFSALSPEVAVAFEEIAFGEQPILYEATSSTFVSNSGRVDLEVSLQLADDAYGVFGLPETSVVVAADESWTLPVTFTPTEYLDYTATLQMTTNDPERPVVVVTLSGTGVPQPTPDIDLSASSLDFGITDVPVTQFVTLTNRGDADLTLGSVVQTGSGAFLLMTDPTGSVIAPGNDYPILITYQPTSEVGDSGTLVVPSNDPDEPEVEIVLLGNGGGTYEYPIAVIDCPGSLDPPEFVQLDGSASYDPLDDDAILTFDWTVTARPDGSTAYIEPAGSALTSLWGDLAGEYEIQLAVTNELGVRSAPARCALDAIPPDLIHIEMLWNTPNADVDLHLRQDGYKLFDEPQDCSYCNPSPNWGESGPDDDPILDLDDYNGYGPENIVIAEPADGDTIVAVHYFDDRGDEDVTVTVRVWIVGVLAEELTQPMSRDEVWDVARIVWPGGAVLPIDEPLTVAKKRSCD